MPLNKRMSYLCVCVVLLLLNQKTNSGQLW